MRMIVNLAACLFIAIAVIMVGSLYAGLISDDFSGGGGMAILFLQLWGVIGSVGALAFGFLGRVLDRRAARPVGRIANAAIAVGLISGLLLFATPLVFG